ncbi:MAG: hypothetical protein ACKPKO_24825, partial [Candidatus Fonsibacter sp.]
MQEHNDDDIQRKSEARTLEDLNDMYRDEGHYYLGHEETEEGTSKSVEEGEEEEFTQGEVTVKGLIADRLW